jgi:hypothetical protein
MNGTHKRGRSIHNNSRSSKLFDVTIGAGKYNYCNDSPLHVFLRRHSFSGFFLLKEVALLRNIRRTASVAVKEDAELMVVDKHVFGKVCSEIYEREMREKWEFCR